MQGVLITDKAVSSLDYTIRFIYIPHEFRELSIDAGGKKTTLLPAS